MAAVVEAAWLVLVLVLPLALDLDLGLVGLLLHPPLEPMVPPPFPRPLPLPPRATTGQLHPWIKPHRPWVGVLRAPRGGVWRMLVACSRTSSSKGEGRGGERGG